MHQHGEAGQQHQAEAGQDVELLGCHQNAGGRLTFRPFAAQYQNGYDQIFWAMASR